MVGTDRELDNRHRHLRQERPGRTVGVVGQPTLRMDRITGGGRVERNRNLSGIVEPLVSTGDIWLRRKKSLSTTRRWLNTAAEIAAIGVVIAVANPKDATPRPYYVPSSSMEPTLRSADEFAARPNSHMGTALPRALSVPGRRPGILGGWPQRGDASCCIRATASQGWVKRVIGLLLRV